MRNEGESEMPTRSNYESIVVESFRPAGTHGEVRIRPAAGQIFPQTLFVSCSQTLTNDYPVGTKFRIQVRPLEKNGDSLFLYSYFGWPFEVVKSC